MNIGLWILRLAIAVPILALGYLKLSGQGFLFETFGKNFSDWFRYGIGSIEIISAIAVLIPPATRLGAALLVFAELSAGSELTSILRLEFFSAYSAAFMFVPLLCLAFYLSSRTASSGANKVWRQLRLLDFY